MGKLFNLKEWLTIPEAAKHLSNICAEEVSDADVLRLGLDGHLKLSVNFVNHARARRGRPIPFTIADCFKAISSGEYPKDLKWHFGDGTLVKALNPQLNLSDEDAKKADVYPLSLNLDGKRFLTLEDSIIILKGIWDLPMIGGERLDIEHEYQYLTGGPRVTLCQFDGGALVESEDGTYICQLQESFDDNEYEAGSLARLEIIKGKIANKDVTKEEGNKLLDEHKERRKVFLDRQKENNEAGNQINNYYPAAGLPSDGVLVVRTKEIRAFERRLLGEKDAEKPLTTRERNNLLTVIAALCNYSDIKPQGHGAAAQISRLTDDIGASLGAAAIKKYLDDIPQALESKKK
ncbi:hypothetical protein [Herbaspirillum sp. C7C8]|uniref:hypothetical protein n=1 Tax=Herbaspirillum sp. C7C8 TaxID=2736665 RepID=UPI001F51A52E|nr:hypothetical protein [Herbaspirillum sp. C7C8]MCI1005231.1 hypothetical protein [Herbaspirillum sp. C7C8]